MIKKIRRRFILSAVLSVVVVLIVILAAINMINYFRVVSDADALLNLLSENGGAFPDRYNNAEVFGNDDDFDPDEMMDEAGGFSRDEKMIIPPDKKGNPAFSSPETEYETRFFSVRFKNGSLLSTDTGRIAAVDTEEAASLGSEALENNKESGFIGDYRYKVSEDEDETLVVFVDCGRKLSDILKVTLISFAVGGGALAAVSLLIVLFSAKIVKPITDSYEKQKRFITDAGHEIKTPIAIINADREVLEAEVGKSDWLDDIGTQTKRLSDLTADLIFLSKMEEVGKTGFLPFSLSDACQETAEQFYAHAEADSKEYIIDIEKGITFNGDEKSIRRLISVITDNAFKYSPEGGRVSVNLGKDNKSINLTVKNTCSEIPSDEVLEHLFDRFYRIDKSRNSESGGHGIGLSIAKAVVDAHKGKISARHDGSEMIFEINLPIAKTLNT